jgi:Mycobacterium membrane protein
MTDQGDPERRIAELERQLAEQKRIAELERQLADAKAARADPANEWRDASDGGTQGPEVFTFDSSGGHGRPLAPDETARGERRVWAFFGLVFVLPIVAVVCFCVAGAMLTLKPSSAMWMSGIVCSSGYHLSDDSKHYSTPSGGSGITMSFRCVRGASSYHTNDFAILGLQFLLVALVLCAAAAVGVLMWRLFRKPAIEPAAQQRRKGRVALIAAIVPILAGAGLTGYLLSRASPTSTDVQSRSPTATETVTVSSEPPTPSAASTAPPPVTPTAPAGPVQFTYTVTGTKAPGDIITITYVDASGRQRTQPNVDIPWTLTLAPTSQSAVRSVQASSLSRASQLNCTITTTDGQVLMSNNRNSAQASCWA